MSNYDEQDEYEEGPDPLQEIKQRQIDQEILADAFSNSYRILTNEMTFNDMLDDKFSENLTTVLAFDPEEGPMLYELENMLYYYADTEEYERCAKIRDIMHETFPDTKLNK
jgi:hypothetical protein|tara:strand:+ start:567 stop:899 length:333 start_codon:yes stop_codon:yes gene_type:complete